MEKKIVSLMHENGNIPHHQSQRSMGSESPVSNEKVGRVSRFFPSLLLSNCLGVFHFFRRGIPPFSECKKSNETHWTCRVQGVVSVATISIWQLSGLAFASCDLFTVSAVQVAEVSSASCTMITHDIKCRNTSAIRKVSLCKKKKKRKNKSLK